VGVIQDFGFGRECPIGGKVGCSYRRGGGAGWCSTPSHAVEGGTWPSTAATCCWLEEGDDLASWAKWAKQVEVVWVFCRGFEPGTKEYWAEKQSELSPTG
jgi:hypothetical protein